MQWAKLRSEAKYSLSTSGVLHYPLSELGISIEELEINGPTIYGFEPLQKALAHKSGVNPDCVAAATGTSMANHLAMATILEPGDEVLIEQPTYEPILAVARYLRASIVRFPRNPETGFRLDPDAIRDRITGKTGLVIVTNLHNPSGVYTPHEVLSEIGDIAESSGARVLVDEVYLECTYPESGSRYSAFHLGKNFVTTNSLTKAYGLSGLRCGWILAQPDLIQRIWRLNDIFSATPPHPAELLSVIALEQLPQIAGRAKDLLQTNRSLLKEIVDSVNYFLDTVWPEFGTILFPKLKQGNVDEFVQRLRQQYDTSVVPGSFFEAPEHFRLGVGGRTEHVRNGLENLKAALLTNGSSNGR